MNRIAVVVPAHDEESLLPGCLASLRAAARLVPVPVELVVVADACADGTATVAAAAGAEVVTVDARNVGRARAAGVAHALRDGPEDLWVASTDADSRVDHGWLRWQLAHAAAGAALVAGTVRVDDWSGWPPWLPARYESRYRRDRAHVHGANLGFAARAYRMAGGFPAVTHDEDQLLVSRFRAIGERVVIDGTCPVRTSSRPDGRAPHGFAAHLATLAATTAAG
ncbi:glycosyltransferase [Actinoplanes sp. CA-030573]|uniref:glycosyltransferase n=1 Tax=Actinoplanes sp. CA-030573 TaxID=3239898 RepID=UPI003D8D5659